ncbi:acyltransferase [Microbacterium sp. Sa4CUA7]|uniref:Acyltransferase n=1 Tax=Microbacterium pullorum TaxID=2762236 RepID=A0ABR8S2C5_9MICO|nr:acyltransferase [Microbacterium pullorum]MBD7957224.1 acyltransferase [Microbacterium pullorum]
MNARTLLRGSPYPYRANSLNMFRLILAALVLVAHSYYIAGAGEGPHLHGENLGGWAVAGFFVLSGFLITRSRLRTTAASYLLHRIARIFPAFLVCLVATAFVFAPLAALIEHGTLAGFLTTPVTPLQYVWANLTLYIDTYTIGATLQSVPYPGAWNGSLWTLFYEFCCYMIVWLLGGLALFRRNAALAGVVYVLSLIMWIAIPAADRLGLDGSFVLLAKLAPFFLGGAFVYFIVERSGISAVLGVASLVLATLLIVGVPHWGGQAAAPLLAYGLLWLSAVVPQPGVIARDDVSYGFYIYAWPVQQLLVLVGVATWGLGLYMLAAALVTLILAWLSWVLVERRAMLWARPRNAVPRPPEGLPGDIQRV